MRTQGVQTIPICFDGVVKCCQGSSEDSFNLDLIKTAVDGFWNCTDSRPGDSKEFKENVTALQVHIESYEVGILPLKVVVSFIRNHILSPDTKPKMTVS